MERFNATMEPVNEERDLYIKTRQERLESAQEIFTNMCDGRLSPDGVMEYMIEKNNASFRGPEDRRD